MVKTGSGGGRAAVDDAAYEEPEYGDDDYADPDALGPGKRVEVVHEAWMGQLATIDKWLDSKKKWGVMLDSGRKVALFAEDMRPAIGGGRGGGGARGGGRDDRRRDPYDDRRDPRDDRRRAPASNDRPGYRANPYERNEDDVAPFGREERYGRQDRDRGRGGRDFDDRGPGGDQRYAYNMGLIERMHEELDIQGSVGLVIGRGGENIKRITAESNARINIEGDSGRCTIEGGEQEIRHAIYLIEDLIEKNGGRRPLRGPPQPQVTEVIDIPGKEGWIIGKGGTTIRHIEARSGARVKVDDGKCTITGRKNCVQEALDMVEDVLGDDEGGRFRGADFSMGL